MPRYGMVIDIDKCSGCQNCVVACCQENDLSPGRNEDGAMGRLIRWIQLLPRVEGEYPQLDAELTPLLCQQCDKPPCTKVCPVSATYKNPDGLVAQIYWRCIGCRYCVNACPYTVKYMNWGAPTFTPEECATVNPDVPVRTKGVTEKCSFCHQRLNLAKETAAAENRELGPDDYVPACMEACPSGAILFGDLDDPTSAVTQAARTTRAYHLLEELGTYPKVTYLKGKDS